MNRRRVLALVAVFTLVAPHAGARVAERSRGGMVASGSPRATEVGARVLRAGGNAVDAAVAAALALAVALPQAGNLGGGGFALVRHGPTGEVVALDFRETAPERAGWWTFLDGKGEIEPGKSTEGIFSAGVPGTVAGLGELHRRFGSRTWRDLVAPAERLAADGVVVDWALARDLRQEREKLARFSETALVFLPGGEPLRDGDLLRQPILARTLARLGRAGPRELYEGETARLLLATSLADGGPMTWDDLRRYRPRDRVPLAIPWRDLTIYGVPQPSSGGVTLMEAMNLIEPFDLSSLGLGSARYASALSEAWRRAFYDRARRLGDPDYVDVPIDLLLRKDYAARLRGGIALGHPTALAELREQMRQPEHTTHICVVDGTGTMVAITTTLNQNFGAGRMVSGAGFLLNDEMDDFALRPGAPNAYGLTGGRENAVEPGKRMLSSMAPTIVLRDGAPYLVLGARGGPRIITTVMQVLLNVRIHGMGLQDAVDFPRFHHQGLPDEILHEGATFSADSLDVLCAMGYRTRLRDPDSPMSGCQAIQIVPEGFLGAADPRDAGAAAGP